MAINAFIATYDKYKQQTVHIHLSSRINLKCPVLDQNHSDGSWMLLPPEQSRDRAMLELLNHQETMLPHLPQLCPMSWPDMQVTNHKMFKIAAEPQQLFTWGQFSFISSSDAKIRSSSRVLQRTKPLPWHCHQRWHSGWDNWVQRGEKYQNENELGRRWRWWGSRASWERAQQSGELSYTSATLEILLFFLTNDQRYLSQNFINLIDRNQQRRGICKEAFRACEQVCKNTLGAKWKMVFCVNVKWEIRTIILVFPVFFLFSAIFLESLKYVSWDMILVFRKQPRGGRALQ